MNGDKIYKGFTISLSNKENETVATITAPNGRVAAHTWPLSKAEAITRAEWYVDFLITNEANEPEQVSPEAAVWSVEQQERVNRIFADQGDALDAARGTAIGAHLNEPQYIGMWEGQEWFLVEVVNDITTNLGEAFKAGDITIARKGFLADWTAYSMRNRANTAVTNADIRRI